MRRLVTNSNRDYYGGALMIAIDVGAMIQCREYPVGTLSRKGPGFCVYSTNNSLFEVNEVLVGGSWPSWSPRSSVAYFHEPCHQPHLTSHE